MVGVGQIADDFTRKGNDALERGPKCYRDADLIKCANIHVRVYNSFSGTELKHVAKSVRKGRISF